jgi:O-antigen ligase
MTQTHPDIAEMNRATNTPMAVHNTYLLLATEVGIVGAFFYVMIPASIFIAALRRCFRYHTDPLAPVCLAFASTFIVFWICDRFSPVTRTVDSAYLYWMLIALAAGIQFPLGKEEKEVEQVLVRKIRIENKS